ncbi:MAG: universal stress protein [Candidatus Accumulibacter meliphilus]|uniref:Universal stress protein n=1 Tax=Candidatus Accumulibacter meliphilus TaxID=2211374 RepID=A0A369XQ06_9PROT|nr:MAG: universal stress protein [Candidatus Accumulibacter meliphilus]
MKPITRILAATDLSAPARHAVDRGFCIAADTHARYTVMHATELDALDSLSDLLGADSREIKRRLADDARATLLRLLADPAHNRGVAADARIVSGAPLKVIAEEADALDADLLIVGARGESFLRHALLGSTASRLLRKSVQRPVLVVKQAPHESYRCLLIPVDFSPASAQAIRLGRQLVPKAEIVLLHVFELPYEGKLRFAGVEDGVIHGFLETARRERRQQLHQLAASAELASGDYAPLVRHGDPAQLIAAVEQEQACDLVIVGKHGRHTAEDLLLGSVTKRVLAESQCDVLVINAAGAPEDHGSDA